jgi:hypothetical protein
MRRCDSWNGNRVGHDDFKFSREGTNSSDDLCGLKTSEHSVLQRTMRTYVPEMAKNVKLTVVTTMQPFGGCRKSELPLVLGTKQGMLGHRFHEELVWEGSMAKKHEWWVWMGQPH